MADTVLPPGPVPVAPGERLRARRMVIKHIASYEYKNDYLYLIIRQAPEYGEKSYLLCCGIDIMKFDPLCRGLAGICSNPAFRGLQLMRADLVRLANRKGATARSLRYGECILISPRGEGWYRESMVLDNVTPRMARDILSYGVEDLLRKVLNVCAPAVPTPEKLPAPRELQAWIRSLAKKK